ncbi:hypothetical protein C7999DRAFT_32733 [Corynascus novoguineensis]|uniref:Uncharacterized protein n=1 Tax=Corynascus novoguineensis TaxID=1126955 RepID=A0AAN7HMS2_9PEZI|nr:hypothetical protein C7999DRAFT_32733 [Corynascus novoguineensis]
MPTSSPARSSAPPVATAFGHDHEHDRDCILLGTMRDPRKVYRCGSSSVDGGGRCLPPDLQRELVRWRAAGSVAVALQRQEALRLLVGPLWGLDPESEEAGDVPAVVLREEQAVGLVPYEDGFVKEMGDGEGGRVREIGFGVDWYEKDSLPFSLRTEVTTRRCIFLERIRHLVVKSVPALVRVETRDLGMMPVAWCAQTRGDLEYSEKRLNYERRAHLRVRWDAIQRLETPCLDPRGFGMPRHSYLDAADVLELARSLQGKRLKLLIIAGLRGPGGSITALIQSNCRPRW